MPIIMLTPEEVKKAIAAYINNDELYGVQFELSIEPDEVQLQAPYALIKDAQLLGDASCPMVLVDCMKAIVHVLQPDKQA